MLGKEYYAAVTFQYLQNISLCIIDLYISGNGISTLKIYSIGQEDFLSVNLADLVVEVYPTPHVYYPSVLKQYIWAS